MNSLAPVIHIDTQATGLQLPQSQNPINFLRDLYNPMKERLKRALTTQEELEIARKYIKAYPFGVPLRIDNANHKAVRRGVAWFRWSWWVIRVVGKANFVMDLKNNPGKWSNVTDHTNLYKLSKPFFGVPASAACCLFMRNGRVSRICPVCDKSHSERIGGDAHRLPWDNWNDADKHPLAYNSLKFANGTIKEWEKSDYQEFKA